jgi:hypothetical protein
MLSVTLPDEFVSYQVLEHILGTQMVCRGDTDVAQILVKWSNMITELTSWEDKEALKQ